MVSVSELKATVAQVNAKGRASLEAAHGIALEPTATTSDIIDNIVKIPPLQYVSSVEGLYYGAMLPEGAELVVYLPEHHNLSDMFRECKELKKVKLIGNEILFPVSLDNTFNQCQNLEEVDFTEYALLIQQMSACFNMCKSLVRILGEFDLTGYLNQSLVFLQLNKLQEIRLKKGSASVNLTLAQSPMLSEKSVESIVEGLATLEPEQARNLKLNSAVVAKITDQQRSTIYSKGWTLVE